MLSPNPLYPRIQRDCTAVILDGIPRTFGELGLAPTVKRAGNRTVEYVYTPAVTMWRCVITILATDDAPLVRGTGWSSDLRAAYHQADRVLRAYSKWGPGAGRIMATGTPLERQHLAEMHQALGVNAELTQQIIDLQERNKQQAWRITQMEKDAARDDGVIADLQRELAAATAPQPAANPDHLAAALERAQRAESALDNAISIFEQHARRGPLPTLINDLLRQVEDLEREKRQNAEARQRAAEEALAIRDTLDRAGYDGQSVPDAIQDLITRAAPVATPTGDDTAAIARLLKQNGIVAENTLDGVKRALQDRARYHREFTRQLAYSEQLHRGFTTRGQDIDAPPKPSTAAPALVDADGSDDAAPAAETEHDLDITHDAPSRDGHPAGAHRA